MGRKDIGNAWLCVAAVAAAMLATWPFAELGYGDDTAYAHVALVVARTGHLVYNGWETAFLMFHALCGALVIRLFGFSFVSLRIITMPFALGAVWLCYVLVRRAGLPEKTALLVTLVFGLSPLFLPVAVSFMTDVPALFFLFASLYSLTRAAETSGESGGQGWMLVGVLAGFIGGTSRQVVWLAPLTVLPYLAWKQRAQKWLPRIAAVEWTLVLVGALYLTKWFNEQLYSEFQPSLFSALKVAIHKPFDDAVVVGRLLLMLLLVILPAAIPLVVKSLMATWRGPLPRQLLVGGMLLLVFLAIAIHPSLASIPWVNSTLNWQGINGDSPLPGRPIVLTRPIRATVALLVYVTACALAGELFQLRRKLSRSLQTLIRSNDREFTLVAMSLFSLAYLVLVLIRSADFDVFDRYLLAIMPWSATLLLRWFETDNPDSEWMLRKAMPISWALLAILGFYAVASTQDLWALAKARAVAAKKIESSGVPRTAIDAGFEYNAWTELPISGHLNNRRVINPPGAYRPGFGRTPDVVPLYRLEYAPEPPETVLSEFGTVPYFSLLPPFHKQVSIDRVLEPLKDKP